MKTIVVIEDDYIIRDNIIQILIESNFNATGFDDGNLALKNILNSPPDLIICDIMMPKMSGYEVIKAIKENSQTNMIPFIFTTAKAENKELRKGMELGASDYLIKPFTIKQLLTSVNLKIKESELQNKVLENRLFEKLDAIKIITNHEYNTSLNGILSLTNLLASNFDTIEKEDAIEYLNAIKISAERLTKSNNKLFRIIDLLANNKPLETETIDLSDIAIIIKNAIEEITNFDSKNVIINADKTNANVKKSISFSFLHLSEIIKEMIHNAIKFAAEGTTIKIKFKFVKDTYFILDIENINYIENSFILDIDFLNAEDCTKGAPSIKSGLFIINKLCQLNDAEFKIVQNKKLVVSSSIKMKLLK